MFKISFHGYFTFILDFIKGKHFFCISGIQNGFEKAKYILCVFGSDRSSGCHSVCVSVRDKVLILLISGSYLQAGFKMTSL